MGSWTQLLPQQSGLCSARTEARWRTPYLLPRVCTQEPSHISFKVCLMSYFIPLAALLGQGMRATPAQHGEEGRGEEGTTPVSCKLATAG